MRPHAPGWFPGVRPYPDVDAGEPCFGFTILEPWASCIVEHDKRIENRGSPPPERLRRRAFWILVHTGAKLYPGVTRADFTRTFRTEAGDRRELWPACPPFPALTPRVIIGAARVVGFAVDGTHPEVDASPWAVRAQVHWLLDPTVIRLPTPIAWEKGELGLWAPNGRPSAAKADDPAAIEEACVRRLDFLAARDAVRVAAADPANHRRA